MMKKQRMSSHAISGAFVFLLLGVFAIFATLTVLLGVGAYQNIANAAAAHNGDRIAPSYLRTMVRGHDETGGVRVEKLSGILREDEDTGDTHVENVDLDSLVLEDEGARTRIFVYDGWLYECSEPFDEEAQALPEGVCIGYRMQPVCAAQAMEASIENNLLSIRLFDGAAWSTLSCALHAAMP